VWGIDAIPLPAALNNLVYAFCKVRGYKVIVRLLNNEPRYVEPMLSCIRLWDSPRAGVVHVGIVWQTKYVMLLWLSHLMLAPFELSTLSTTNEFEIDPRLQNILNGLPDVAKDVVSVGFGSLSSPSKERESAVILLVRLSLRRDMQVLNLPSKLVDYSTNALLIKVPKGHGVYHSLGHLALLYSILNLGTDSEVAPYLLPVFRAASQLATSDESHHLAVRDSAPARKLLVKILRVCLVHSIALSSTMAGLERNTVDTMLEQVIQYFLDCLGDKDSPVRMAASKALSIVTLKLDPWLRRLSKQSLEVCQRMCSSKSPTLADLWQRQNCQLTRHCT
jgi:tubulin-specific chaperone D